MIFFSVTDLNLSRLIGAVAAMKKYVRFYDHSSCSQDTILQRQNMFPLVPCKALILSPTRAMTLAI
jgi:hypothetical protein